MNDTTGDAKDFIRQIVSEDVRAGRTRVRRASGCHWHWNRRVCLQAATAAKRTRLHAYCGVGVCVCIVFRGACAILCVVAG